MIIGVPREIKSQEYRAGLIPRSVKELTTQGHQVFVEKGLGLGIGIVDEKYEAAGAVVLDTAAEVFQKAEMIVKVKEPQPQECEMLRKGQILFTYLHLAAEPSLAKQIQKSGATAISYETVTNDRGALPLLVPMSQVAGRLSIQAGAASLEKARGGRGVLLGGVPGVAAANVVVIGGGVVGFNAIRMAVGMEAQVTVIERSLARLEELDTIFGAKLNTIYATKAAVEDYIKKADLVVGAVLIPGDAAPRLITRDMLKTMRPGSVLVDVSIDQGGCFETSRPTTHENPTYIVDDVIHYCVANMPGAVPRTSTFALNNVTLPFVCDIANKGAIKAMQEDPHLMNGLNVYQGKITHAGVAKGLSMEFNDPNELMKKEPIAC